MLASLILGLLAQAGPGPVPAVPAFNLSTTSSYGGTPLTYDPATKLWVGCLSRPFRYVVYPDGKPRICGTTSGTARIRVEMDDFARVTLRWNAAAGGICAVDGDCTGTFNYSNKRAYYTGQAPFKAYYTYNSLAGNLPPFFGDATVTITAP